MPKVYWKLTFTLLFLAVGAYLLYPSYQFYRKPREQQESLRKRRNPIIGKILNLGLDLQGGMHLLLELKTDTLPDDKPETIRDAIERAMEVIRNRIDASGLAEPLIVRQGEKWIVVQLPGVQDREAAKSLIGQIALLEFRIVEGSSDSRVRSVPPSDKTAELFKKAAELNLSPGDFRPGRAPESLKSLIPTGMALIADKQGYFYMVKEKAEMDGSSLVNAHVDLGGDDYTIRGPTVSLEFNKEGAKKFGDVTSANVGRNMAIVLDGIVQSSPLIQEPITDGRGQISGISSPEEAKMVKIVLQAGALPAPLEVVEERTVGPGLGEDSIKAGLKACGIGLGLVFLFMVIYYKWSGLLANGALVLNLFLLLAAMAFLHATLTMPGIAGILLSIGMAVDANVLILERIREELRLGKTPRLSIDQGYDRAFSAILDGNLTTGIAALFLFQFGTGPIKGFGVSLMLGLLVSMFTAIVVTHMVYELWLKVKPIQKLSV